VTLFGGNIMAEALRLSPVIWHILTTNMRTLKLR